jgi:anti-anti-sigma factor
MQKLKVEQKQIGDFLVFEIAGQFQQSEIYKFSQPVFEELALNKNMILNCSDIEFIDSSGIGLILKLWMDLKKADGSLFIIKPKNEFCASVLKHYIVREGEMGMTFDTLEECTAHIEKS